MAGKKRLTDEERRLHRNAQQARYAQTEHGKAYKKSYMAKYRRRPLRKAYMAAWLNRYRDSGKSKAYRAAYIKTEKGKEALVKARLYGKSLLGRFSMYKHSARHRGLQFLLSVQEFTQFWQRPCHYCGEKIDTIGLDRVDNSKGYVLGNVVACCTPCNKGKLDMTAAAYISHCRRVVQLADTAVLRGPSFK